ncbi:hypothetical protein [Absidia glauca]|uniref:FAM192A/Fyv6 N-terminal domain-containing protein n=1 Tax=Absidia glauca TaxID=4829 RepID=A0A168R147_ABSGL|nr:hypothetical protein [Absidia glauca]
MSYKSFVSHSVIDNDKEQVIDQNGNDDTTNATDSAPVEYDPRTLYERLQEQKTKKEEEFREATRFSNLVKRIDPDEAAYYKSLSDTQQQLDEDLKLKERMELEEYRRAVEQARTESTPTTAPTAPTAVTATATTSSNKPVVKPKKDLFGGIVVLKKKKRTADQMDDPEETPAKTKKGNVNDKPAQGKKKDDTTAPEPAGKDASAASVKNDVKAPVGLTSLLAAYDDSDSDSDS